MSNHKNTSRKKGGKRVDMKFSPSNKPKMDIYAIYPDFWARKWGDPPLLGFVYADSEFAAIRKAEFHGVYRRNISFGAMARKVANKNVRLRRKDLYR